MDNYDLVIKNGTIFNSSESFKADIGIKDGKIKCISEKIDGGEKTIEAKDKLIIPGAIDIHTHIDAPLHGSKTMDDWFDATAAAAFGGVTSVVDYPIQEQGQSLRQVIEASYEKARDKSVIDYSFSPVVTQRTEEVYKEIPDLINEGFPTFKVFMAYAFRARDEELIRLLDVISSNGGILGVHAENDWAIEYVTQKMLKEGKTEPIYHCLSRPPVTENEATKRVISLAEIVDAPVLIVHVSSKGAIEEIIKAKSCGRPVYAETCPHFLVLDEKLYDQPIEEAAKYVVTPPLRSKEHREALWNAISSGGISLISSDHCAFSLNEKLRLGKGAFNKIPHGAPGIETRLPVVFSEGVCKRRISMEKMVEMLCVNPAKIAGIYPKKGVIAVGSDADIAIIDEADSSVISTSTMRGICDFSPFEGYEVCGKVCKVIAGGEVIVSDGKLNAKQGRGKLMTRKRFNPF